MGKRIKFICFYDRLDSKFPRRYILSATTKIEYLINALNKIGYAVDIISASYSEGGKFGFSRTTTRSIGRNSLTTFGCFSLPSKRLSRAISCRIVRSRLKKFLYDNIAENDIVIVYHSPFYARLFSELRQTKKFCLIGEIEEIYQNVTSMGHGLDIDEYHFINQCDRYIVPTRLLLKNIPGSAAKPHITVHGLYNVEPSRNLTFGDSKIHVVYAGTFDPRKGGAAAAAAAAHLPENYHMHICGFGSKADTDAIVTTINSVSRTSRARVTFDGLLSGEEFIRFIQKCEIGLSTQNPDAAFNATSFPSKILNYLSNGLKVVTIDIPAIRTSDVGAYMFYYTEQTPGTIAAAIVQAHEAANFNGRALLAELDNKFTASLAKFLE